MGQLDGCYGSGKASCEALSDFRVLQHCVTRSGVVLFRRTCGISVEKSVEALCTEDLTIILRPRLMPNPMAQAKNPGPILHNCRSICRREIEVDHLRVFLFLLTSFYYSAAAIAKLKQARGAHLHPPESSGVL